MHYNTFDKHSVLKTDDPSTTFTMFLFFLAYAITVGIMLFMSVKMRDMSDHMTEMVNIMKAMETNTRTMCMAIETVGSNYTCA